MDLLFDISQVGVATGFSICFILFSIGAILSLLKYCLKTF